MDRLTADGFETLGVYDPAEPHAARKLELLEYLVSLGATADDLVEHRDDLPGLATIVASRAGEALTLSEAAERAGVTEERLLAIIRAAGFAEPGPEDRVISEPARRRRSEHRRRRGDLRPSGRAPAGARDGFRDGSSR